LRYCRPKYVQATDILRLASDLAELLVHLLRITPCQLRHTANTEEFEIAQHRRANRNQVAQLLFFSGRKTSLTNFGISYKVTSLIKTSYLGKEKIGRPHAEIDT